MTKLRLGLVEGPLFFTGIMVLCGFSAYVLSEITELSARWKRGAFSSSRKEDHAVPHASSGSRASRFAESEVDLDARTSRWAGIRTRARPPNAVAA